MKLPEISLIKTWLKEGYERNPGPLVNHCELVGNAAKSIANQIKNLNSEQASIMGLVHDIGRICGKNQERHTIDGFNFLKGKGYEGLARVCITHCFPNKNINANIGIWDCDETELDFIENFLMKCKYND